MTLDDDTCYRALCAKDERFDGTFFVGVSSTGIYCRPICPARTPRRNRCLFFTRATEAERAGYRACFRCRPELAPGTASVDSLSRVARRAVTLIDGGFLDEGSVETLATELGVTSRHLRRAMETEIGMTPIELAQARRLALAKRLLHDSDLSLTNVAMVSGFGSVRRFNAAFASHFGRAPSSLRSERSRPDGDGITLRLDFIPPYDWSEILAFLGARATPGVEVVTDGEYRRTLPAPHHGWVSVRKAGARSLRAKLHVAAPAGPFLIDVIGKLKGLFDVDARPHAIGAQLREHPMLAKLVTARPGLRVPGAFDGFEISVRAVLGQQVSVRAATTLSGRLVAALGAPSLLNEPGLARVFPSAQAIAGASVTALRAIGLPEARARTLHALATAAAAGGLLLEPGTPPEAALAALQAIPGIGPWTAHYVAMRALRWPDAFPSGDLGIRKALSVATDREAESTLASVRPWRAYATMHLWASL